MHLIEQKLIQLCGLKLPNVPNPGGVFALTQQVGNLLIVGGQISSYNDVLITGRLGKELTVEQGQEAAKYCLLNLLAIIQKQIGSFDSVKKFVMLQAFVQSDENFHQQTQVVNGASQLLKDLFGEDKGLPARMAIGSNSLPINAAVEIMTVLEIQE